MQSVLVDDEHALVGLGDEVAVVQLDGRGADAAEAGCGRRRLLRWRGDIGRWDDGCERIRLTCRGGRRGIVGCGIAGGQADLLELDRRWSGRRLRKVQMRLRGLVLPQKLSGGALDHRGRDRRNRGGRVQDGSGLRQFAPEEICQLLPGLQGGGLGWRKRWIPAPSHRGGRSEIAAQQLLAHSRQHHAVDAVGVAKTHLDLGGVDVNVHILRRHSEQQNRRRVPARFGQAAIGFLQSVLDELVADKSAIEVDVLILGGWPGQVRQACDALQTQFGIADLQRQPLFVEVFGPGCQQSHHRRGDRQFQNTAPAGDQLKADAWEWQGQPHDHLVDVARLGGGALEELASGGRVEEQVAHLNSRPDVSGGGLRVGDAPAAILDFVSFVVVAHAADDAGVGYSADTGQSLAAKAHGGDAEQVVIAGEFAGGVLGERQSQFLGGDAAAIVGDADEVPAAFGDFDGDVGRAGVDGVFDEFFDDRGRALDHLAGGDAINQRRRKLLYLASGHKTSLALEGDKALVNGIGVSGRPEGPEL